MKQSVIDRTRKSAALRKVTKSKQRSSIHSRNFRDSVCYFGIHVLDRIASMRMQRDMYMYDFVKGLFCFYISKQLFKILCCLYSSRHFIITKQCSLYSTELSTIERSVILIRFFAFYERVLYNDYERYMLTFGDLMLKTETLMHCNIVQEEFAFIRFVFLLDHFSLSQCIHNIYIHIWKTLIVTSFENKLLSLITNVFYVWHSLLNRISRESYAIMYTFVYHNHEKTIFLSNQNNFFDSLNNENPVKSLCYDLCVDELSDSKNVHEVNDCESANALCAVSVSDDRNSNDCMSAEVGYTDSVISSQNENKDNISSEEDDNICSSKTNDNIRFSNENKSMEPANDYIDRLYDNVNFSSSNDDDDDDDNDSSNDKIRFGSVFVTDTDQQNFSNSHCSENSTELASVISSRRPVCNIIENPNVDLKPDSSDDSKPDIKSDASNDELKKILRITTSFQKSDKARFRQKLTVLPVHNKPNQTERSYNANESTSFDCTDQVLSPPKNDRSRNDNLALSDERGHFDVSNAHGNVSGIENAVNVFPSVDAKQGSDSCQGYVVKTNHKRSRRNRIRKTKVPSNDEADSAPLLRARNGILDAPPVEKPRPSSSKLKCYELQIAIQETKPDQAVLSELGACGGDPLTVGYGTEETQIFEAEIEVDGVEDTAQETSQNQAVVRNSPRTTAQTQPEETTPLQNRRQDVFPDPVVDDSDLQRFEPMMDIVDKIAVGERVAPQITMRYEMLRLCTLRSFPKVNKPFIIRIAQAGFYYANSGDEVVCYCCAKRKSGWQETDVPLDVHRQLSPNCRFLMSNSEVNVSVKRQEILASRRSVSAARVTSAADDTENNATAASQRIQNPNSDHERNLTRSVFRRTPAQFGNATTSHNSSQDLTSSVAAPSPPSTVPQPYSSSTTGLTRPVNTMNTNTAQYNSQATPVRNPKYPTYVTLATRLASFRDCIELAVPGDTLAEAGFFYAGFGDCCRCFQCGVGLRHWSVEDDAWIEHARWSRNCSYVREKKGEEFTNLVQMAVEYQQNQERESEQPTASRSDERPGSGNRNVDSLLHSDAAQSVLEMGYTPEMIRRAIQIVLNNVSSESNITAALLMEQIFAMEESELSQVTDPLTPTAQSSPSPVPAPEVSTSVALPPQLPATLAPTSYLAPAPPTSEHQALIPETTPTQAQTSMTSATKPRDHTARNQNNDEVTSPEVEGATAASYRIATRKMPSLEQKKLREENARMKQQTICTKCKQNDVSIVFLPCGHLVTCEACAETVRYCTERNCGKYIKGTVRTYAA